MKANFSKTLPVAMALGTLLTASILPSFAGNGNFRMNHPRRAEVLWRDNHINQKINNQKGDLGGHYGQLKAEDRAIHRQEQRDAKLNDGHITRGEQNRLNREENQLNNQIKRDDH